MERALLTIVVCMLIISGWLYYGIPRVSKKIETGYTYKMVENAPGTPGQAEYREKITKWVYTLNGRKKILFFEN